MATRVIDDNKLNNIAVAIQAKDNGGQMTVDEMPGPRKALDFQYRRQYLGAGSDGRLHLG